jgi:ABC-type siderophore export system fused ATPase/permease subunit
LYQPRAGTIFFNGEKIKPADYGFYRNQISAIFTNNYLFQNNYDHFQLSPENSKFNEYCELLKLTGVITVDGNNCISSKLSKGQQKRLAMIYALLEDKEILVLDEWAAEQDPVFRNYFYRSLLPLLQQQGKTIIAVTHDDDYYHCADRIVKFGYGKVIFDSKFEPVRIGV